MNNLTDVVEQWLQSKVNDTVAGHSSRIAYLEECVSRLSERLEKLEKSSPEALGLSSHIEYLNEFNTEMLKRVDKLEKAYPDMATTKDLLKDTDPAVLADKLHEYIEQLVDGKLGECVKEVHLEENVEAILDRRSQASDDDKRDAQRYRWLREQYWDGNVIAVVERPRDTVKIGTQTYSGVNLDALIDKELQK